MSKFHEYKKYIVELLIDIRQLFLIAEQSVLASGHIQHRQVLLVQALHFAAKFKETRHVRQIQLGRSIFSEPAAH
jgi:hypothetical protein